MNFVKKQLIFVNQKLQRKKIQTVNFANRNMRNSENRDQIASFVHFFDLKFTSKDCFDKNYNLVITLPRTAQDAFISPNKKTGGVEE